MSIILFRKGEIFSTLAPNDLQYAP